MQKTKQIRIKNVTVIQKNSPKIENWLYVYLEKAQKVKKKSHNFEKAVIAGNYMFC
jgi:hypothetical protein